ncbi:MAG: GNAT family N-acetyltransferase [Lachnospiraceae bacterium]|nr:GNAT family N-acetyltransferase [Lachnospiraceae bacterium]
MISYSEVTDNDLGDIIEYYERYLNSGGKIKDSIRSAFENREYFGFKAEDNGRAIGFFTFQDGIAFTYPHEDIEQQVIKVAGDMKVATVDALMVSDRYRGLGIATELAKRCSVLLKEKGVELIMVEIWIYPDGRSPARKVYDKMGKTVWSRKEELFYRDSADYGIICPICGKKCMCGAFIEVIDPGVSEKKEAG